MCDQKLDNQLNLAIRTSLEEREKSADLNAGYSIEEDVWEIIVKYSGEISTIMEDGIGIVPLLGNYAIATIPQEKLQDFSRRPQIEFVEKPKRLYFAVNQGKTASCIREVQRADGAVGADAFNLTGKGVLIGIVDSGVDVSHPDFRNPNGSTRILRYWDQSGAGTPPKGYIIGREWTEVEINAYLGSKVEKNGEMVAGNGAGVAENGRNVSENGREVAENNRGVAENGKKWQDMSGHGTAVLGIMAGNGSASNGRYRGIAYDSEIIAVKIGNPRENSFPKTTELLQGVDYLVRQAMDFGRPMVINLSFGNNYGSHEPCN